MGKDKTEQFLQLAISPCPNDTFMFYALLHGKTGVDPAKIQCQFLDIEELNQSVFKGIPDIAKMSYSAYSEVSDAYQILESGSALGHNCGPLLISKQHILEADLKGEKIAIPGEHTTANLLLNYSYPELTDRIPTLFSEIEDSVINGKVAAGVIIHENRFTYHKKGLIKLADLGEKWEASTGLPIPLGCIAIKRSLPEKLKYQIASAVKSSVEYAFANKTETQNFVSLHAQEMDPLVQKEHINLYVNQYSINLGMKGKEAIKVLLKTKNPEKYKKINWSSVFITH